jgi:hypothetical protein
VPSTEEPQLPLCREAVAKTWSVRWGRLTSGMPQNFIDCDREQAFLLPLSLRDWLPEDHLAWFVIDAVAEMDLTAFYSAYRADRHGRAAYDGDGLHSTGRRNAVGL